MGGHSFNALATQHSLKVGEIQIWRASVLIHADAPEATTLSLKGASSDSELLLTRLKAFSPSDSAVRQGVSRSIRKLRQIYSLPLSQTCLDRRWRIRIRFPDSCARPRTCAPWPAFVSVIRDPNRPSVATTDFVGYSVIRLFRYWKQ